jgi:hypothetical protein
MLLFTLSPSTVERFRQRFRHLILSMRLSDSRVEPLTGLKARPSRGCRPMSVRAERRRRSERAGPLLAPAPNHQWIADFSNVWPAEGLAICGCRHRAVLAGLTLDMITRTRRELKRLPYLSHWS